MKLLQNVQAMQSGSSRSLESPLEKDTSLISALFVRRTPTAYSDSDAPESPERSPDEDFGSKLRLNEEL
jgi:hypothetical protein